LTGIVVDAGGLIAIDRNDRRVIALLELAAESGIPITVPATALAQAMRSPARQSRLNRLIRQPATDVVSLDGDEATAVGMLLAQSGTSDIADAHVVLCAQRTGQSVVTSDAGDLRRIDPMLQLIRV
jgi:predicted nucleic acid-binding protein